MRKLITKNVVEPTIALYIPTHSYVYVSPNNPRLYKRLEEGLTKLKTNEELEPLLKIKITQDPECHQLTLLVYNYVTIGNIPSVLFTFKVRRVFKFIGC
jgi:hypothetical protein